MAVLEKEKHLCPDWKQEGNLIFKAGLVVVPINPEIRKEVLCMHHDNQVSGHPGCFCTLELITQNFWWPGISKTVAKYVNECQICQ
jgi:hypothetical protein